MLFLAVLSVLQPIPPGASAPAPCPRLSVLTHPRGVPPVPAQPPCRELLPCRCVTFPKQLTSSGFPNMLGPLLKDSPRHPKSRSSGPIPRPPVRRLLTPEQVRGPVPPSSVASGTLPSPAPPRPQLSPAYHTAPEVLRPASVSLTCLPSDPSALASGPQPGPRRLSLGSPLPHSPGPHA